jgi:hypothetical protein
MIKKIRKPEQEVMLRPKELDLLLQGCRAYQLLGDVSRAEVKEYARRSLTEIAKMAAIKLSPSDKARLIKWYNGGYATTVEEVLAGQLVLRQILPGAPDPSEELWNAS